MASPGSMLLQQLRHGSASNTLNLLDWRQSICWAFMGVMAVGLCISSTNKRITAERQRILLRQQKVELLQELFQVQQQVHQQQEVINRFTATLQPASSGSNSKWQNWTSLREQLRYELSGT